MGRAGEKQGLEWGGRWKGLVDTPHFQLVGNTKHASDLLPIYNKGGVAAVWQQINKQYPTIGGTKPTAPTVPTVPNKNLPIPNARLEKGSTGTQVRQLQDALFKLGYKALDPAKIGGGHGIFGPLTDRSLRDFQAKHGLFADGIYGPKTRAALTKALGGTQAADPLNPTPANPNLSNQAVNINKILRGTGLDGEGATIARLAQKYNVPPEFAIAMFRKEASFAAPGTLADRNNNPGNIRFANQDGAVSGARGFAKWKTMGEGIEGFFKLMNKQPYRGWLDKKDYRSIIFRYAPPSENNSELYVKEITGWIGGYRSRINGN
jgi:peptidoglycan hydrolase-like protein with peptidoglycan-binding domain